MTIALQLDDVGVQVASGKWLLRNVTLSLLKGEILGIVGPNGAGKSTLLAAMAGDLVPDTGQVLLNDNPIREYKPSQLALLRAVLPQQTVIQFAFTAREIVTMGRSAQSSDRDHLIVDLVMDQVDAGHLSDRVFPSLSVGEQSRVSLARILAQETPILLLDEPTAALDLRHQQLVMEVAQTLAAQGAAVAVILHDLNLAAAYVDRVAILRDGEMQAVGTPWEAFDQETIERVFECAVDVTRHPARDCPLVLPLMSGKNGRS